MDERCACPGVQTAQALGGSSDLQSLITEASQAAWPSHLLPDGKNLVQGRRPWVSQLHAQLKPCLHRGGHRCPQHPGFLRVQQPGHEREDAAKQGICPLRLPFLGGKNEISLHFLHVHAAGSHCVPSPPCPSSTGSAGALGHGPCTYHLLPERMKEARGLAENRVSGENGGWAASEGSG